MNEGQIVELVEIKCLPEVNRIRGRIRDGGWCSVVDTSNGSYRWVKPMGDIKTKTPAAWFSEGEARRKEEKWPEAIAAFQNCVALDANDSWGWFQLGYAYNQQNGGRSSEAEYEPYTRCIALDPKHAAAHGNLGNVLKDVRKDYDGAEKMYRKAIELNPKHAVACWNLSRLLENQKNDIPGAIKAVEEYIRRGDPDNDGEERLEKLRAKLK